MILPPIPTPFDREGRLDAEAFRALAEAQVLQRRLFPLGDLLAKGGVPLLKQALRHLGLPAGHPRPPCPLVARVPSPPRGPTGRGVDVILIGR